MTKLTIRLPFEGFYNSKYSDTLDSCEEQDAEHFAELDEYEQPKELRLSANDYAEIFFKCADYSAAYQATARIYVDAFGIWASELLGFDLGLEFESMDSPREYNFATDRVFAYVDSSVVERLLDKNREDGFEALRKRIKDTFTSYDGFISHYSNNLETWTANHLNLWDHNELCTLLESALLVAGADEDWQWEVFYAVTDDGLFEEWSECVDWQKFHDLVKERREELAEEMREVDPDYNPPTERCQSTLELPF